MPTDPSTQGISLIGSKDHTLSMLSEKEKSYRRSAQRWKLGYRVLLIGSILMSSSAAILAKSHLLDDVNLVGDLTTLLAGSAAMFMGFIGALSFEKNWRVNRRARQDVEILLIELRKETATPDDVLSKLQSVIKKRADALQKGE